MDANDVKKALADVRTKAINDKAFMAELIDNPRNALASMGISLPPETDLVVSDQTDESFVYLNLPPKQVVDSMELSDEQMEQVAGGEIFFFLVSRRYAGNSSCCDRVGWIRWRKNRRKNRRYNTR